MNNIVYAGSVAGGERVNANRKYCEIIYCKGGGKMTSDGQKQKVPSGCVCFIPALKKREYGGSSGDICVLMEQPVFPYREARVLTAVDSGLYSALSQSADAFGREDYGGVLSALGDLIAAYIYAADGGAFSPVVESVVTAIEKNVGDASFSLEDYMRTLPLNYDYIRKLFAKETGVTPHGYLLEKRIARAKSIMDSGVTNRYSNYSVSQVAEASGFSDPLYFSRVFKKYCGMPPSEYLNGGVRNKKS